MYTLVRSLLRLAPACMEAVETVYNVQHAAKLFRGLSAKNAFGVEVGALQKSRLGWNKLSQRETIWATNIIAIS